MWFCPRPHVPVNHDMTRIAFNDTYLPLQDFVSVRPLQLWSFAHIVLTPATRSIHRRRVRRLPQLDILVVN